MLNSLILKKTIINSDKVTYLKNDEMIATDGKTLEQLIKI